jgi:redox-sensitive bicupin YhaK (pirin superfamily)
MSVSVSNLDARPEVTDCVTSGGGQPAAEFYQAREVPLGGVRAVNVDRVLPQRGLPTVGAWCFLDQFGPHDGAMSILPHPHTGLQTVTWPFIGEIEHRDTLGSEVVLKPGQLNLMTSGRGIAHSEFSIGDGTQHGLQLWVALPAGEEIKPAFAQYVTLPEFEVPGLRAKVFMGVLGDVVSPATVHTPLVGAEIAGTGGTIPLRPDFEYGLLVIEGSVRTAGVEFGPGPMLYLGTGRDELTLTGHARVILLGGEPFPDELVMWWNFVGRGHDDIAQARADWEAADQTRFGRIPYHGDDRIPAPRLPMGRLTPRKRRTT